MKVVFIIYGDEFVSTTNDVVQPKTDETASKPKAQRACVSRPYFQYQNNSWNTNNSDNSKNNSK